MWFGFIIRKIDPFGRCVPDWFADLFRHEFFGPTVNGYSPDSRVRTGKNLGRKKWLSIINESITGCLGKGSSMEGQLSGLLCCQRCLPDFPYTAPHRTKIDPLSIGGPTRHDFLEVALREPF